MNLKNHMKKLKINEKKGGSIYSEISHKKKKKRKKEKVTDRQWYEVTLNNYLLHMHQMIFIINDIAEAHYMVSTQTGTRFVKNLKIDKKFKKLSRLDWDSPADINSATYRGRFATYFLMYMIRNCHKIVKRMVDKESKGNHKYEVYNTVLDKIITITDVFITGFLSSNVDYSNPLKGIYQFLVVSEGYNSEILLKFQEIETMIKEDLNEIEDNGIIANNLSKMAFVLATDSIKVKKTPEYVEGFDFRNVDLRSDYIGKLGYAIYRRWEKSEDRNILYTIFVEANPLIYSNLNNINEQPEIAIGVQALTFLKLCIDNQKCTKYIDKMIKR